MALEGYRAPARGSWRPGSRRGWVEIVLVVTLSASPLVVLLGPAVLHLRTVAPLFQLSETYLGVSRAIIVAIPLGILTLLNLLVAGISRSIRVTLVAAIATTGMSVVIVFGALASIDMMTNRIGPAN